MVYSYLRRRGETGRRAGLKILWTNHPCRFESDRRHQRKNNLANNREVVFSYIRASRVLALEIVWIYEKKISVYAVARLLLSAVGGISYIKNELTKSSFFYVSNQYSLIPRI